jgi:hypothetical protein
VSSFGTMVPLIEEGPYKHIYQKVQEYLEQHFSRLPKVDLFYDAKSTLRSETKDHQMINGKLIVVQIHAHNYKDAIGLLCLDNGIELDAVSTRCKPELRTLYGYHD